jgi:hypothetical protein
VTWAAAIYGLFKALLDAWIENLKEPTVASSAPDLPPDWRERFAAGMQRLKGRIR